MVRAMDNPTTEDSRSRVVESQVLKCGVRDWCHAHIGMDRGEQSRSLLTYSFSACSIEKTGRGRGRRWVGSKQRYQMDQQSSNKALLILFVKVVKKARYLSY